MFSLKTIRDINLKNKKILFRVALDIPLADGQVKEDYRIRQIIPTLNYLLRNNCSVVILTWLGRPEGKVVSKYKLNPVAKRLAQLIKQPVKKMDDCVGLRVKQVINNLKPKQVVMLENVRFHPEEQSNNPRFAKELTQGLDLIVFDAFAQAHRVHASTVGILDYLPAVAGLLLEKEITQLSRIFDRPVRPAVLIIGGAKISDKVALITNLAPRVDKVLIGGAVAHVFLKAQGIEMAQSFLEDVYVDQAKGQKKDLVRVAKELIKKYRTKIILPLDLVAARSDNSQKVETINLAQARIKSGWLYNDIGSQTIKSFGQEIAKAKIIIWNGPMGLFEKSQFVLGTRGVALAIAKSSAVSILGGGDTEKIVKMFRLDGRFSHISTGGGAMLNFLGGEKLPALLNLAKNQRNKQFFH
ncbi:MAG: phosphoglycerate kinase [Patescibacteria group bacterium]